MTFIQIKVTGIVECKKALDSVVANSPKTKQLMLEDTISLIIREAKNRAHVITGNMKRNIGVQNLSVQSGSADVVALALYSAYENARGEGHDYFTQALEIFKIEGGQMIKTRMDQSFKSSGVPVK